ncbi:hypothetical protein JW868_03875, partial [Candidatus Woesearchaeota archaeon]|nr:hypothetical protein [Candidatus Woesearchaeota archaeon]
SALSDFYNEVVINIISGSIKSQTILISGGELSASNLYSDSYIEYNYTPVIEEPQPNEISLIFQTDKFDNCSDTFFIYEGLRLTGATLTSYSAEHWTDLVTVNSQVVFNLSEYYENYSRLGDPYRVNIPVSILNIGAQNSIYFQTGDSLLNMTNCSMNNSVIYSATVNSTTARMPVVENAEGCNWIIEFEDGTNITNPIPGDYFGAKNCTYTNESNIYDNTDAYDIAVNRILDQLDFDNDGRVLVNLEAEDLEIVVTLVSQVPYMWGPSIMTVEVWR